MRLGVSLSVLRLPVAVLLALVLLGIAFQECAALKPACKSDCCLPTPGCLGLNFDQPPASVPAAPFAAPAAQPVLLAVLSFVAVLCRFSFPAGFPPLPFRSDPGGRRAPSRAQLHCWTL